MAAIHTRPGLNKSGKNVGTVFGREDWIFLDCQTTWVKLDNMETRHAKSPQVDLPEYTPVSRLKKHVRESRL
ncbi:MAG: hypothetical protein DMG96_04480 [Acidobacteria bacterium]|nr:MAG: hypothetical protein DMG96_04480 [Acidobacteriota bacterium]